MKKMPCKSGKNPAGIRWVYGIRGRGKARTSEVQSVLFRKGRWTIERAKDWLKAHGFKAPAAEDQKNYLRFRQLDPGLFQHFAFGQPGRKNPNSGPTAAALSELFHGRPAKSVTEYTETLKERAELAELGRLIQLLIERGNYAYGLKLVGAGVKLCATPEGGQLYLMGGDQSVDLAEFDIADEESANKDHVVLGELAEITYHTSKAFHNFEPTDYQHPFGEDGGSRPTVCYDQLNELLYVVGGAYQVRREGIVG